jgi:hypothetical protein
MQKAVALAHSTRVVSETRDDNLALSGCAPHADDAGGSPRLFRVPSAWWDTPAVTTRALSPRPEEARTARRFARELLAYWGLEKLADDAETIIDELVVNAARHGIATARGPAAGGLVVDSTASARMRRASPDEAVLRLCVLRRAGEVMFAVVDPSDEAPVPRQPDWAGESGRGLQIVGALSDVWGWSPIEGHGKAVWAVLRIP